MDDTTNRQCGNCWHSANFTAGECPGRVMCGPHRGAWEPANAPADDETATTEDAE
jgi:hypothetical protein